MTLRVVELFSGIGADYDLQRHTGEGHHDD